MEGTEQKFQRIGDRFTDVTGAGSFLINFKGLEMGDGDGDIIFMKVHLGRERLWKYSEELSKMS